MKIRITKIGLLKITILILLVLIAVFAVILIIERTDTRSADTPTAAPTAAPFTTQPPTEEPTATPIPTPTPTAAPDYAARRADILLVNVYHRLADDYEPENLVYLVNVITADSVRARNSGTMMARTAAEAANAMFEAAARDGVYGFVLTTSYRSRNFQQELYSSQDKPVNDKGYYLVVPPFASEHRTGLVFDITNEELVDKEDSLVNAFGNSAQGKWLSEHCWEYGFIIRYPIGKEEITRVAYEPWHFRYVGVEHAMAMKESGECLEEYLGEVSVQ